MRNVVPVIKLLYFEGCPNVGAARENLASAIELSGSASGAVDDRRGEWEEVDLSLPDAPAGWKGFPSPTVLVNGRDVETGESVSSGMSACRLSGPPEVEAILDGIREYGTATR